MKNAKIVPILNVTSDCGMVGVANAFFRSKNWSKVDWQELGSSVCWSERHCLSTRTDWLLQSPDLEPCDQIPEQFPEITELLMKWAIAISKMITDSVPTVRVCRSVRSCNLCQRHKVHFRSRGPNYGFHNMPWPIQDYSQFKITCICKGDVDIRFRGSTRALFNI